MSPDSRRGKRFYFLLEKLKSHVARDVGTGGRGRFRNVPFHVIDSLNWVTLKRKGVAFRNFIKITDRNQDCPRG